MFPAFNKRSCKFERLDTGDYTREEYELWLSETKLINGWLGDSRALRLFLEDELRSVSGKSVSVLDVGAGSGELLKAAQKLIGEQSSFLVGAELSGKAANAIARGSGLLAVQCDALKLPFTDDSFDFAISSLLLHHLDDEQVVTLIREMNRVAKKRFLIIDLHRHPAAYYLYRIFGPIFLQRFTIEDGSLSILRSFRPNELRSLAKTARITNPIVKRRFAFRLVLSGSKRTQQV